MPPRWRARLSMNASDRSVSARTLRSIMPSCSSRSSVGGTADQPEAGVVDDDIAARARGRPAPRRSVARRPAAPGRAAAPAASAGRWRRSRRPARSAAARAAPPARDHGHARANTRASSAPMPAEAPVMSVDRRHAPWPRSAATRWRKRDALGRRYAEQVGDPPDQVVLVFGDRAVGIGDPPHHLDHAQPLVLVERIVEQMGEMIEIDAFSSAAVACSISSPAAASSSSKRCFSRRLQLVALGIGHVAVDRRGMDQQRGGRQTKS